MQIDWLTVVAQIFNFLILVCPAASMVWCNSSKITKNNMAKSHYEHWSDN